MTTAAWPATLPQCPTLSGFSETPQPNVTSFKPEVGTPKVRRRSTAKGWMTEIGYRMTNAQVLAFYTFYETTLEDGSLPFTWPHPITKTSYNWMFNPGDEPKVARISPTTQSVQFTLVRLAS